MDNDNEKSRLGFTDIIKLPNVMILILLGCINIFFSTFIWTISPLWMSTP